MSQLQRFLAREQQAGRIQVVDGEHVGDPAAAVAATAGHLEQAADAAGSLRPALARAHELVAWASTTPA